MANMTAPSSKMSVLQKADSHLYLSENGAPPGPGASLTSTTGDKSKHRAQNQMPCQASELVFATSASWVRCLNFGKSGGNWSCERPGIRTWVVSGQLSQVLKLVTLRCWHTKSVLSHEAAR